MCVQFEHYFEYENSEMLKVWISSQILTFDLKNVRFISVLFFILV